MAGTPVNVYDEFTDEVAYPLSLKQCINEVAAKIPDQWENFGHQLLISTDKLDGIKCDPHNDGQPKNFFRAVLRVWEETKPKPYNWATVLNILASDIIGNPALANEIASKLASSQRSLTASNAFQLLKTCEFRIVSNWSKLGASLGVPLEARKGLRTQAMLTGNYDECLEECLAIWLKNEEHKATWEELFKAVEREERVTAKRMRDKYMEWK